MDLHVVRLMCARCRDSIVLRESDLVSMLAELRKANEDEDYGNGEIPSEMPNFFHAYDPTDSRSTGVTYDDLRRMARKIFGAEFAPPKSEKPRIPVDDRKWLADIGIEWED